MKSSKQKKFFTRFPATIIRNSARSSHTYLVPFHLHLEEEERSAGEKNEHPCATRSSHMHVFFEFPDEFSPRNSVRQLGELFCDVSFSFLMEKGFYFLRFLEISDIFSFAYIYVYI